MRLLVFPCPPFSGSNPSHITSSLCDLCGQGKLEASNQIHAQLPHQTHPRGLRVTSELFQAYHGRVALYVTSKQQATRQFSAAKTISKCKPHLQVFLGVLLKQIKIFIYVCIIWCGWRKEQKRKNMQTNEQAKRAEKFAKTNNKHKNKKTKLWILVDKSYWCRNAD